MRDIMAEPGPHFPPHPAWPMIQGEMLAARTLKILALLLAAYALLIVPAYLGPSVLEEASAALVMVPLLSTYFFHWLGIPGLLEHGGACGWGWCSPTAFGWAFTAAFWVGVFWLLAWGLARLTRRSPVPGAD